MRASAYERPVIPPGFWERAEVRRALRDRDMGTLFRLAEESAGLSHTRLGMAVGLTQGRISEVVNGIRGIAATHVFERIADGLGMPDSARLLLGLSPRHAAASTRPVSTRRARPGQDGELLRQITAARGIDASVIRVLQGETDTIRLLDRRLGAPAVAGKLEAHISQVETGLYYSLLPGNRERLAAVLADASALAGWQAIDMGRLPRAWEHFERATAAAREADDACLLAFAGGEQAYVLLDLHRPKDALAMVRATYDETAPPCRTRYEAGSAPPKPRWPQPPDWKTPAVRPWTTPPTRSATAPAAPTCPTSPSTRPTWPGGAVTVWSCSATRRPPTS
jgi:transcriptional regulator with XRE-family HTH domain